MSRRKIFWQNASIIQNFNAFQTVAHSFHALWHHGTVNQRILSLTEADFTRYRAEIQGRIDKEKEKRLLKNLNAKAYNARLKTYLNEQN